MHNTKASFMSLTESYINMLLNALSVYISFLLTCLIFREPPKALYPTELRPIIAIICYVIFRSLVNQIVNNYRPTIAMTERKAMWNTIKTSSIVFCVLIVVIVFANSPLIRGNRSLLATWALFTSVVGTLLITSKNRAVFIVLKFLRKRNFMLKRTIIVGDNTASVKDYIVQIANNPNCGVMILGCIGDKIECDVGCEKLGSFKDFVKILDMHRPTDVVFAIDSYDKRHLIKLVNYCDDRCIRVSFLPVIYGFFKHQKQIEQVGSIPVVNAHVNPLNNRFNSFMKRLVDVIGSLMLIVATSPIMLAAIIGIKLTSDGPILFRQERVGKMGKTFTMYKFRSMPVNRDAENNWSAPGDARPTKFGSFMRRTAIDELPQFFNVLLGHMSLVGPRPEMPKYVQKFRETIPLYMIKHYVKPGITGLAQIKGLRGDTSLEERIQEDIYYIENWSLFFDFAILLKTPFKAFNKYERYVKRERKKSGILGALEEKFQSRKPQVETVKKDKQKILYTASTMSHIRSFHEKYIAKLREDGHEVFTMASGEGADYNIPFEKKMLSTKNVECKKMIRNIVDKENFDLIILNTSLAAFVIRSALDKKNRPRVVNIVHGYLFPESPKGIKEKLKTLLLKMAEKSLKKKTDAILTMNDEDFRIATRNNLTKGPIIPTFGCGIPEPDFDKISTEPLRKKYSKEGDFILLFVGELSGRKNQKFLIDSLPKLKETVPGARIWLLGDGDEMDNLKQRAKKLGVSDSINFFGRKSNPTDYMMECDLYVSPSKSEGLPFNIVEALGCEKTVLASKVKGHTDILSGGAGLLYTPGDKKDFCTKVTDVYNNKITISERKIFIGFRNFSEEVVFYDTYQKIKEASAL